MYDLNVVAGWACFFFIVLFVGGCIYIAISYLTREKKEMEK